MAGDLIDALTAAGIAQATIERAQLLLQAAQAARDEAAASQAAAADALARVTALTKAIGVQYLWSGPDKTVLSLLRPDGSYGPGSDLEGPEGPIGITPDIKVGTIAEGEFSVIRQPNSPDEAPVFDFVLPRGLAAWTPVIGSASDGARRPLQITDWTGGQGAKPAAGVYVGATGLVTDIALATDFRGVPGPGGTVVHTGSPNPGDLAVFGGDGDIITTGGALTPLGKQIVSAATAAAVLAAIGGQAALGFTPENTASKGIASGYAGLDSTGKVPAGQLPASVLGDVRYAGAWNAATNTPAIPAASSANMGAYYVVQTAGTTTISGQSDWQPGDWLVSNGTGWDKIDNTDAVKSVAGLVGVITAAALKNALGIVAADVSGLALVATSGAYADLTGKPSLATVATSGSAADLATGTLPGARLPAFTGGDVTSSAGALTLTIAAGAVTFAKIATAAVGTVLEAFANTSSKLLSVPVLWAMQALVALTDAATIAVDLNTGLNFKVTLGGNRTLGNPTNAKEGQSGIIRVLQDATGSRTLAYGTAWDFGSAGAPTLQTTAGKEDLISYIVVDAATPRLRCSFLKGA